MTIDIEGLALSDFGTHVLWARGRGRHHTAELEDAASSGFGTYVLWVDEKGLHHSTELKLLLEHCEQGRYGLTQEDAKTVLDSVALHTRGFI